MRNNVRKLVMNALLSALAAILMLFFEFNVPLMPGFIKMDFSDLPALIAAFTFGPISGILVSALKNLIHLFQSSTLGIGELSNFLIAVSFVLPAGIIYKKSRTLKGAITASLVGAVSAGVFSVFINYYIIYPLYINVVHYPLNTIIEAYSKINPSINNLWQAIIIFNAPFTFIKEICNIIITFLLYKRISPFLKGKNI